MPRISRYQQQKLASSLVGTPGVDTSTSDVFSSIAGASNQVLQLGAQELQKKRALEDTVQVNKSIIDFENQADQLLEQHKKVYASDPGNKTDLLIQDLNTLATDFSEGLQTSGGKLAFASMSRSAISRVASQERVFAENQRSINTVNGIVEAENAISTEAYRRQDWTEKDFKDFMDRHEGVMAAAAGVLETDDFVKLDINGKKSIATAMLEGKSRYDAVSAKQYLDQGMFDDIFDGNELSDLQDRIIRNAEQSDRLATKALNDIQDKHKFDMYTSYIQGAELSVEQIQDDVRTGMLSASDGTEMLRIVSTPAPTYDNMQTKTELYLKLARGELSLQDVFNNTDGLSRTSQQEFVQMLTSDLQKNPSVKRSIEIWDAQIEKDAMGVRSLIDAQEFNNGVEEILTRSLEGKENPFEVVDDLKKRMIDKRRYEDALSATRIRIEKKLGRKPTADKVTTERENLLKKYRSGAISEEDADMEATVLEQILAELE